MIRKSFLIGVAVCSVTLSASAAPKAAAQQPPANQPQAQAVASTADIDGGTPTYVKPETPEQRRNRVGAVDPGPNPDEKTVFSRYGRLYHIAKVDRTWSEPEKDPAYIRPFKYTPFVYELYQQNSKYVWVWVDEPQPQGAASAPASGDAAAAKPPSRYNDEQLQYLKYLEPEFAPLDVPQSGETVVFEEASDGLPKLGSWRNTLAVADMNGDGFPDIIAPPQRGGSNGLPSIFLGDGKGHWRPWNEAVWPFQLDYGSVVAADFNKDGHMDLAFAVHLQGVRVFLGDGKGHFTDSSTGLPKGDWGSRRLVVADFDHDGYPDLIAISEGPRPASQDQVQPARIRLFLNRQHGAKWAVTDAADRNRAVGGDYLAVGNFNGDEIPDFVSGSIYFGSADVLYLSQKNKPYWAPESNGGKLVPYMSYYFAVAAGPLTSKKVDDAVVSYVRFWPDTASEAAGTPKLTTLAGLDRITFAGKEARRVPILRYPGSRPISGLAIGDLDGDGRQDILFTRSEPSREFVLLRGDGKGNFERVKTEGLSIEPLTNYDLLIADVNGDGRPDVIIAYESGADTKLGLQNGSIHVFLNRGPKGAAPLKASK